MYGDMGVQHTMSQQPTSVMQCMPPLEQHRVAPAPTLGPFMTTLGIVQSLHLVRPTGLAGVVNFALKTASRSTSWVPDRTSVSPGRTVASLGSRTLRVLPSTLHKLAAPSFPLVAESNSCEHGKLTEAARVLRPTVMLAPLLSSLAPTMVRSAGVHNPKQDVVVMPVPVAQVSCLHCVLAVQVNPAAAAVATGAVKYRPALDEDLVHHSAETIAISQYADLDSREQHIILTFTT